VTQDVIIQLYPSPPNRDGNCETKLHFEMCLCACVFSEVRIWIMMKNQVAVHRSAVPLQGPVAGGSRYSAT